MINLNELNKDSKVHPFGDIQEQHLYAVGTQGRCGTGSKIHLLNTYIITDSPNKDNIGKYRIVDAQCNGNGSHNSRIDSRLDTKDVTCSKCLKELERIAKFRGL